ncbi:MAG: helix-turn-helix transcriptional regulator [Clostridia bacterium]|nr:helix-turn-helix transcriptional regulator [Clostridia bacterium]
MQYLEKLKALKEEKHMTNAEIARLSNIPLATITRIFNGSTPNPTFDTFSQIAIALGASLDEIAGLKQPEAQPISAPIEATLTSYSELLREKDERLIEKDKLIESLKEDKERERKEKHRLAFFFFGFVAFVLIILTIDILNGHFGYFRY